MKCLCGYVQPEPTCEEIPVYFQSGARKGQLKHVQEKWTCPDAKDKFILLGVEKGFSFTRQETIWSSEYETETDLYACPKCFTVKLVFNED